MLHRSLMRNAYRQCRVKPSCSKAGSNLTLRGRPGFFTRGFRTTSCLGFMDSQDSEATSGSKRSESQEVLEQCSRLYDSLTSVNDRLGGVAISSPTDRGTKLPYVLLVGNHSSGKSSFINYVLQRNIQTAGVAPTDDTFTVIAPGAEDKDSDGPTLVGDPDMGFASLRQFGPTLIHHTQLKQRDSHLDFMLVDSPGMIDAPVNLNQKGNNAMDRGYDFPGVVRWLAQRADIVMLFFDPDKPGTTGETMDVLLRCLSGMDHKLIIILNKADQFYKIHDFARAYGSLCWNLSKVIPRKDLPPIYTMSLPNDQNQTSTLAESLRDLEHTRDEVVQQVMQAPKRRIDNVITNLFDSTSMLILYSKIWNDVITRFVKEWRSCRLQEAGWSLIGGVGFGGLNYLSMDPMLQGGVFGGSILSIGALFWYHQTYLQRMQDDLTSMEALSSSFQRTHARQVHDADEFTASLYQRSRASLQTALKNEFASGGKLPTVSESEMQRLQSILDDEIPKLRRLANDAR
eukprot:CAMPEP_0113622958 /NCGR_PEP_ID=MMETSP0017_2-20120614/11790_1 /TAXON_ID=2856 /ORGANISM="Cylindrotheca closterium" /LENGTH=513 /DNA_ID=CAMNT_0000532853 /DNA_START=58 /DNA_END=1599 /DNA_ORIENTATION=- /assembly_acc=CAM_ASM_000147